MGTKGIDSQRSPTQVAQKRRTGKLDMQYEVEHVIQEYTTLSQRGRRQERERGTRDKTTNRQMRTGSYSKFEASSATCGCLTSKVQMTTTRNSQPGGSWGLDAEGEGAEDGLSEGSA